MLLKDDGHVNTSYTHPNGNNGQHMTPLDPTFTTDYDFKLTIDDIAFNPPRHRLGRGLEALRRFLSGRPTQRKRRRPNLLVNTLPRFARVHREAALRLDAYASRRDARYRCLGGGARAERCPRAAHYMYANNEYSRVTLARVLLDELREAVGSDSGPFTFVTVVPVAYLVALADAETMPVEARAALIGRLQALARQTLKGMDYVAMVEPALYKRRGPDGPDDNRDGLFWHVHAVVWGTETTSVRAQARANIGERHINLFGRRAVWVKAIDADEVDLYALYIVKAPLKHYDLRPTTERFIDQETGEVFTNTGYRQQSDTMQTGDRVRLANAMAELTLDRLLFGGGAGAAVVTRVQDRVLARWRAEERAYEERQALVGGWYRRRQGH